MNGDTDLESLLEASPADEQGDTSRGSGWYVIGIIALVCCALGLLAGLVGVVYVGRLFEKNRNDPNLPTLDGLTKTAKVLTRVYDRNGIFMCEIGAEKRIAIRYGELPQHLVDAVIATEDQDFFKHNGIDKKAILRAGIRNLRTKKVSQGGSTITQQVVKNYLLTREKKLDRKVKEVILAWRLEEKYSKEEILELYLNRINYGRGRYGVETAAKFYFGKSARELTTAEAAMLAGIPQSPERLNPLKHMKAARVRMQHVLGRMVATGKITAAEREAAEAQKIVLVRQTSTDYESWLEVCDYVKSTLEQQYCAGLDRQRCEERVSELGLTVKTSIDARWQAAARRFLEEGVRRVGNRHKRTPPQGSVVVIDPATREVRVLVSGAPYLAGGFNRAVVAKRQPGSLMKAFVYAAGFGNGAFTPQTVFEDYEVFEDPKRPEVPWPLNYEPEHMGAVTVRSAFSHSVNTVAVQAIKVAGVDQTIAVARAAGIVSPLGRDLSLALGTSEVTPLEMANSYATFSADGRFAKPVIITEIGSVRTVVTTNQAMPGNVANAMRALMTSVVEEGTGKGVKGKLPSQAAGKTGTTSNHSDAWFAGFTPELTTVVWVGYDNHVPLGSHETGANAALPVWLDVMHFALTGKESGAVYKMKQTQVAEEDSEATASVGDESDMALEEDAAPIEEEIVEEAPLEPAEAEELLPQQ